MEFKWRIAPLLIVLAARLHAAPRPVDLKDLDSHALAAFAAKASNTVDVTLDGNVLKMAAGFISSSGDEDAVKLKKLIAGVKSITVRTFEFKTKGQYSKADVNAIRKQLKTPEWSSIVTVNDKESGETSEVYVLGGKDKPGGILIISAEPTELTFVQILGTVDISDLSAFEDLGVPDVTHHGKKEDK
jgi:hypothetical protein